MGCHLRSPVSYWEERRAITHNSRKNKALKWKQCSGVDVSGDSKDQCCKEQHYIGIWIVVLDKTVESPLDCKEIKLSVLREINLEYPLAGLMLKLKFLYFGHLMWKANSMEKTLMLGKDRRQKEKGMGEDDVVREHHWLKGQECEQTPGDREGQRGLVRCSPWGHKESDMTELLNHHHHHHLVAGWSWTSSWMPPCLPHLNYTNNTYFKTSVFFFPSFLLTL